MRINVSNQMKAIILAAGDGSRMGKLTQNTPKPLVILNGKSIIERQLLVLKKIGVNKIYIITGPHNEKFNLKNVTYVNDLNHKKHDILGSLITARKYINDEIIITYSDQIFDEKIMESISNFKGDIGVAVDLDWEKNYENRDQHPKSEAENVLFDKKGNILELRKNIQKPNSVIGESLGLMKLSKKGSKIFLDKYLDLEISHKGKFHNSPSLEKGIISDMMQELINSGINVEPILISGKWCEIDTQQDLERAEKMFS